MRLADEVAALEAGTPVVALETSALAQGLPPPRNREVASVMEEAIRGEGAVPAWIWVDEGEPRIGAGSDDLDRLCEGKAAKVARRDLPAAIASGGLGATTVSATLWLAHRAGIAVMATGGIGGVHPGKGDVSADLLELSRTPGTVVCSGPKSITDPVATAERLEELGVGVVGYGCDRLPFFVVREAPVPLEHRVDSPKEAAAIVAARRELDDPSALLICVPVPEDVALEAIEVASATTRCEERAVEEGIRGKELTPYLLRCLSEETDDRSLNANVALLLENARVASAIAATAGSSDPRAV